MSIKLQLDGFEELIKAIEKAGGSADKAVKKCMKQSAEIMQEELISQMQKSHVDADLINAMPAPQIEDDFGRVTARVGYRKGTYDPHNPSAGYKAVFINYGTPNRKKHGKVKKRGYITRAKNRARPKIKQQQETALKDILRGLE